MAGQARGALRAKINKFAETNKRESEQESGLGLLNMSQTAGCWDATCGHVQHESMAKTPMRPYSNNLPISPPTLTLLLLPSQTSNVHNHFLRVCVAAVAAAANNRPADKRANPTLSTARARATHWEWQRQRGSGLMGERPRLFCIALFSYLASFVFSRISSSSSGAV